MSVDGKLDEAWLTIRFPVVHAGYFFGQYPCGWLIGRFPAQKVIAISCLLWGATVLIMTQCRSYQSARKLSLVILWVRLADKKLSRRSM